MRVAILSYCGTVGKTTMAAHFLAPRMPRARFFAVETINETASGLGLEVEKMKGDKFGKLFRELMVEDDAIVDVGASNVEDFIGEMTKFDEAHGEFDFFVIPVTPGAKEAKETLKTVDALAGVGVPAEKIRILFNRVDSDVAEEFAPIFGYARATKNFTANPAAAVHETDIFDSLSKRQLTIKALLDDPRDYRAELRALGKEGDPKKAALFSDMHVMKSQAKPVNRELDGVFDVLFK